MIVALLCAEPAYAQGETNITGTVSQHGVPIEAVLLRWRRQGGSSYTNHAGAFSIVLKGALDTLDVFKPGHERIALPVSSSTPLPLQLQMLPQNSNLEEVIVSTGYQRLPKERATGSFATVGKQLLNEQSGTSALARLEAVTNGLYVDRLAGGRAPKFVIRGLSTIRGPRAPLIILNDFPFNGNIDNINPNDIETITILKDAAAASIWGTQAGNGVIVITTKQGRFNQKITGSINSNVLITAEPNLFDIDRVNGAEYANLERFLFDKGAYNSSLASTPWASA